MDVKFAGGLHYDPLSRPACLKWMQDLLADHGKPRMVAVEWDGGILEKLGKEREAFNQKWSRFRKQDPPGLVRQLAETIAWEADVFQEVFGDLPVVWLEDGRDELPSSRGLAFGRWWDFQIALAPPNPRDCPVEDVLPRIHNHWIRDAEKTQKAMIEQGRDPARDQGWAKRLLPELRGSGWALVIVGALHASDWDDQTLYSLLKKEGHACASEFLLWKPSTASKT